MTQETLKERLAKIIGYGGRCRHDVSRDANEYWDHIGEETREQHLHQAEAVLRSGQLVALDDPKVISLSDAAQCLLCLLNMSSGEPEVTREQAKALWDAASDAKGYTAVRGFLEAVVELGKEEADD